MAELGQTAVAVTDHGWVAGGVKLTKACKEKGIKPIVGSEVYISAQDDMKEAAAHSGDNFHLTLLCATAEGYKNLRTITSLAYLEGLSYKPRIDKSTLKDHADGLIVLSGCIGGELPQAIIEGNARSVKRLIEFYQSAFGENFFIELMSHGRTGTVDHVRQEIDGKVVMQEHELNDELVALSVKHGIPLVATNDAHYLTRDDGDAHDTLLCLGMGKHKEETPRLRFPGAAQQAWEFFIKSEAEMRALSKKKWWREACDNTVEVANRITDGGVIPMGKVVLPKFNIPHDPGFEVWKKTGVIL